MGAEPQRPAVFDASADELEPYSRAAFGKLAGERRLSARGFDPALYRAPPAVDDAIPQARNIRSQLHPGYRYAARLRRKQRAAHRLMEATPPHAWARWLGWLEEPTAQEFLVAQARRLAASQRRRAPVQGHQQLQAIQALRHSERQFVAWFLEEMGGRLAELSPMARAPALDALIAALDHPDALHRRRAARVLGRTEDPLAASALRRALEEERDPRVLFELVSSCARATGDASERERLSREWMRDPRPTVRIAAYRLSASQEGRWVDRLLQERLGVEEGRPRDDLLAAVAARSPASGDEERTEGPVRFYGIATHSRKVLFCVDVSPSMEFPMDGEGGKREPRIERTRRELVHTISALKPGTEFNILLFAGGVVPWQRGLVPATEEHREAALRFLDRARILPATNIHGVLEQALRSGAETVYLLTDGEPTVGTVLDPALIVEDIAARNAHGAILLHTIGLSQDQNAELLVNLAHRNGGRYVASR